MEIKTEKPPKFHCQMRKKRTRMKIALQKQLHWYFRLGDGHSIGISTLSRRMS